MDLNRGKLEAGQSRLGLGEGGTGHPSTCFAVSGLLLGNFENRLIRWVPKDLPFLIRLDPESIFLFETSFNPKVRHAMSHGRC